MDDLNGRVLAGLSGPPLHPDLVAIELAGGRISRTWTRQQWQEAPASGDVLDLAGATVLPGIDDSHLHGYEYGRSLTALDLRREVCPDLGRLQDALRAAAPEPNGWIRGIGWDDAAIRGSGPEGQLCAADLDVANPDVPMFLTDVTGHQAVCNSEALRRAGLVAGDSSQPEGGVVVRGADGRPTGLLREAAVSLVNAVLPSAGVENKRGAILAAQERLLSAGVTAFTDPGLGPGASTLMDGTGDLDAVAAYQALEAAGELHMRIDLMLLFGGLGGTTAAGVATGLDAWGPPRSMPEHGHLGISQLKVFADGIPRSRTAWMTEPYDDCTHGHLTVAGSTDAERVAELRAIVDAAARRGWQIGVHTTGDRATETVVTAFTDLDPRCRERRHYIIHGDFASTESLQVMAAHGVTLNSNPSIRWMVGDGVSPIIGAERNARRQPIRTAWDLGVNVCASSDAPVAPPDWRVMVAAAMTRAIESDPSRTDGQRLSAREALQSLTSNAAWQGHAETWRGRLESGYAADLIVMDGAVDWEDPWSLPKTGVVATITDGVVRHGSL